MTRHTTDELESGLRALFDEQAGAMNVAPREWDDVPSATVTSLDQHRSRRRWLAGAGAVAVTGIAAALVISLGLGSAGRVATDAPKAGPSNADPAVKFETPQVVLTADDFSIQANGETFTANDAKVEAHSDPGDAQYQTLELGWNEHGVEMRLNIYFKADGNKWWADEIRTYNGKAEGDWIEYHHGPYFTAPLRNAYTGNVDLAPTDGQAGHLHFTNMQLEAFRPPAECANESSKYAIHLPDGDKISFEASPMTGFGAAVEMYDTTTCTPVDLRDYDVAWTSTDPGLTIGVDCPSELGSYCNTHSRADLGATTPGTATLRISVRDPHTHDVVATRDLTINMLQPSAQTLCMSSHEPKDILDAVDAYRARFGATTRPTEAQLVDRGLLKTQSDGFDLVWDDTGGYSAHGVGVCSGFDQMPTPAVTVGG